MSAERQWMVCALAALALSAAADVGAQKQTPHASGPPGKVVPFVGVPGSAPLDIGRGGGTAGRGISGMNDTPGHGGAMPASASRGASSRHAGGKEESDAPGESIQASAGNDENAPGRQRRLHEIPTCD